VDGPKKANQRNPNSTRGRFKDDLTRPDQCNPTVQEKILGLSDETQPVCNLNMKGERFADSLTRSDQRNPNKGSRIKIRGRNTDSRPTSLIQSQHIIF
jgi:hypothetical protein